MKLSSAIILLAIAMVQLPASLAFHLMNSGQSSDIEPHYLIAQRQRRMDRETALKKDCFSDCRAQLLDRNDDICKSSAWHVSGSDTFSSCRKGWSQGYHMTCVDRCKSTTAMASPLKKASSFEACKHFQKGKLRSWCLEGFASVYNVVNASLKQFKVAAEAELAIQAAEELIVESEADAKEDLDADKAAEGVEGGVVDGQVDGDQAVNAIVKDEADVQVHAAVGENVVVIGVDAQVDAQMDANRAVAELKPGNSTNEPPKTEASSMLWQLDRNVIISRVGVEAKAVEAVGEQLKIEAIMDTLKSEPNFLTLIGSNFDYSRSHDLETNHEAKSYERDAHTSNKTAAALVPDSPFRDKHNRSKLPSCVPAPIDSGVDLNFDSDIIASIDRECLMKQPSDRGPFREPAIGSLTVRRECSPCVVSGIEVIQCTLFSQFDRAVEEQHKHLSNAHSGGAISFDKADPDWTLPPLNVFTTDALRALDQSKWEELGNSTALYMGTDTLTTSVRFSLQYHFNALRCRSPMGELISSIPRWSLLYPQVIWYSHVHFKLKIDTEDTLNGAVSEEEGWSHRCMIPRGTMTLSSSSPGIVRLEWNLPSWLHFLQPSPLLQYTLPSVLTLVQAQDILEDCHLPPSFVSTTSKLSQSRQLLAAVDSCTSSWVALDDPSQSTTSVKRVYSKDLQISACLGRFIVSNESLKTTDHCFLLKKL